MIDRLKGYERRFGGSAEAAECHQDGQAQGAFFVFGGIVIFCEPGSEIEARLTVFGDSLVELDAAWFAYAQQCYFAKLRRKGETCSDAEATAALSKVDDALQGLLSIDFPRQIANALGQLALDLREAAKRAGALSQVHVWN